MSSVREDLSCGFPLEVEVPGGVVRVEFVDLGDGRVAFRLIAQTYGGYVCARKEGTFDAAGLTPSRARQVSRLAARRLQSTLGEVTAVDDALVGLVPSDVVPLPVATKRRGFARR